MMKRIISILLCATLLLSTGLLFASCKKGENGDPKVSKKTVSVDLTDYTLVYGEELSSGGKQDTNNMATALKELTGINIRSQVDAETEDVATEDLEILVGNTNRKETTKALKAVKDNGWVIRVFDNKIVIAGTNSFMTRAALSYFSENYVNEGDVKGTSITLNEKVVLSGVETVSVLDGDTAKYVIVYDDRIDDKDNGGPEAYDYASDANPNGGPDTDYTYTVCDSVRSMLAKNTGARTSIFPTKLDSTTEINDYEIFVGNMDQREDVKAELCKLEANQYGITVKDGKVMILAWNDITLALAFELFQEMLTAFIETDDAGTSKCYFPTFCSVTRTLKNNWVTDFPKPEGEGIVLDGTRDVSDESLEYIYSGSGVNNAAYLSYCEKLESEGFSMIAAEKAVEGSTFRTYLNEESGVSLHVYHSAYTHAAEFGLKNLLPSIRIIAASTEFVTMPDAEVLSSATASNGSGNCKITQLKLNYSTDSFGNAYIITLADGSFIMYDGGLGKGGTQDLNNMWSTLVALHTEAHNKAPDANKPIHIRAWLMSHEHHDHFVVFTQFLKTYGKNNAVKIDRLMWNGTSASEQVNSNNPSKEIQNSMASLQGAVNGGFDHIKVHTGQTFYFPGLKMEILYTHEDAYPRGLEYFNNSSTIYRTTFTNTGETMIWLGDSERIGGDKIVGLYGATLDSDMVQVAHHGWNGVREQTYLTIAPEVVWWPTSLNNIKGWAQNPNASKWFWRVDYASAHTLPSVELVMIADVYNTTMTFTGSKDDYLKLKDVVGNKEIVYGKGDVVTGAYAVVDKRPTA